MMAIDFLDSHSGASCCFCDKLDRICQVRFASAWHWRQATVMLTVTFSCVCMCVCPCEWCPDLVCVMEACLTRVICVDCGI